MVIIAQALNQNRRSISRQNTRRYIYHFLRPLCEEKILGEQRNILVRIIYQIIPQTAVKKTIGKVVTKTDLASLHRPAPAFSVATAEAGLPVGKPDNRRLFVPENPNRVMIVSGRAEILSSVTPLDPVDAFAPPPNVIPSNPVNVDVPGPNSAEFIAQFTLSKDNSVLRKAVL